GAAAAGLGGSHPVRTGEAAAQVRGAPCGAGGAGERVAPRTAGAGGVASGRGVARPGHPGCGRRRRAGKRVVSGPAGFLSAFAHTLAAMTLYAAGHPARERAIDDAFQQLHDLQSAAPNALFTFLGDAVSTRTSFAPR